MTLKRYQSSAVRLTTILWLAALTQLASAGLQSVPLGSIASTVPTIDGTLAPGEWADAACATDTALGDDGSLQDVEVCVKNDAVNLYMALTIDNADYGDPNFCHDFIRILFDNDNNAAIDIGDNMWAVKFDGTAVVDGFTSVTASYQLKMDTSFGGTADLTAGITHSNPVPNGLGTYSLELAGPLASGDVDHDFDLQFFDSVGFAVHMADGDPSPTPVCQTGVGSFFLPSPNPAFGSGFATIEILEPGIVVSSDLTQDFVLEPGDKLTIRDGAVLTGTVTVNGGELVVVDGSTLDGDILGDGGDIRISDAATVTGSIEHTGGILVIDENSLVEGDLIRVNSNGILVSDSIIRGSFSASGSPFVKVVNSSVAGSAEIDNAEMLLGRGTGSGVVTNIRSRNGSVQTFAIEAPLNLTNCPDVDVCDDVVLSGTARLLDDGGSMPTFSFDGTMTAAATGATRPASLMVRSPSVNSLSNGDTVTVTGGLLRPRDVFIGNIVIDITGAGLLPSSDASFDGTTVGQGIVIDITGAGIDVGQFLISCLGTLTGNNILIDMTGAGVKADAASIGLDGHESGNNIVIDITGAGIRATTFDVALTGVKTGNNVLIDMTGSGVTSSAASLDVAHSESTNNIVIDITGAGMTARIADNTTGGHLKLTGASSATVTGNDVGRHLMIRGVESCVSGGNVVGGKTKGC